MQIPKQKQSYKYMHTIDGKPAEFIWGQITYCGNKPLVLRNSLETIKKDRRISIAYRKAMWGKDWIPNYGHVKVAV